MREWRVQRRGQTLLVSVVWNREYWCFYLSSPGAFVECTQKWNTELTCRTQLYSMCHVSFLFSDELVSFYSFHCIVMVVYCGGWSIYDGDVHITQGHCLKMFWTIGLFSCIVSVKWSILWFNMLWFYVITKGYFFYFDISLGTHLNMFWSQFTIYMWWGNK